MLVDAVKTISPAGIKASVFTRTRNILRLIERNNTVFTIRCNIVLVLIKIEK